MHRFLLFIVVLGHGSHASADTAKNKTKSVSFPGFSKSGSLSIHVDVPKGVKVWSHLDASAPEDNAIELTGSRVEVSLAPKKSTFDDLAYYLKNYKDIRHDTVVHRKGKVGKDLYAILSDRGVYTGKRTKRKYKAWWYSNSLMLVCVATSATLSGAKQGHRICRSVRAVGGGK